MRVSQILSVIPLLAVQAAAESGPSGVKVVEMSLAGSGCAAGSVSTSGVLPDTDTLRVSIPAITARAGRGVDPESFRQNCRVNAKIQYPAGWQFALSRASYSGRAEVPEGVTATAKSQYSFSGQASELSSARTLRGPFDDKYTRTDQFSSDGAIWSPCGGEALFNINSEVRVAPLSTTVPARISADPLDKVELQWRRC